MTSIDIKPVCFNDLTPEDISCLQKCLELDYTGLTLGHINARLSAGILSGVRISQGDESLVLLFNLIDYPSGKELWVFTVLGRFAHRRNFARDFIVELAKGLDCKFISGSAQDRVIKNLWVSAGAQEVSTIYRTELK